MVEAPPLERVVHFTRAIRRKDDERRRARAHGAELGNRDLEFGEHLEQKSLEFLVGPIDFVNQQHGRPRAQRVDGLKQRALDQKGIAVELAPRARSIERVRRVENAQLEQLAGVVPLVHGVAHVEAFIALESNQIGVERGGDRRSQRGFAHAGLAFEEQGALQP